MTAVQTKENNHNTNNIAINSVNVHRF